MRCTSCGFENADGMIFCTECGTQLQQSCASCGFENTVQAKFCGKCGTALGAEGTPAPAKRPKRQGTPNARKAKRLAGSPTTAKTSPAAPEAERRQLTVMFCDLVGSTALSERLDPEDLREVVRAYQQTCAAVITRFEGQIAQYLGDGLLVYFGYPSAHEDDAQRAVRTGLGIVEEIRVLSTPLQSPLQVRIGIHTGPVVMGAMGVGPKREQLALGETPNLAARLQGLAEPDTVIISAATQRLIAGFFDCHDEGRQPLKGVAAPVQVYRVLSESSAQSRLEVDVSTGKLTPLVGRVHEVGLVLERWAAAQAGDGQVVLLSGEPGIGKSRLVQEVKERVAEQGALCLEFRCSPYFQNSALYPVLTHLQRLLRWQRDDPPETKREKLQQTLARYRFAQADTVPLLAALLSLPQPEGSPPLTLSPQKQKQKTQEALVAWLVEEAERAPMYCIWEDLHWADPSTVDFLELLLNQIPTTRILLLLTARPEFTPPWSSIQVAPLILTRLPRMQAADMIAQVTSGKPLPAEVHQQIVSKTDGIPLFVEELTKMVLESGLLRETKGHYELTGPLPPLAIPATLHDSLMARLDKLATGKEVAQLGATLGREFSYDLIQAISPVAEPNLQQALTKLVEAEVLYQRGLPPQAHYLFKHALIQDAAYQSLLKSKRQQYHKQIVQVLEERFPEIRDTQPELLAHHYTEASLIEQALPYWQQAGQRASQRSAHAEAITHLTTALDLLKTLPDTPEGAQHEIMLQIALGVSLTATKGWAAPEVEKVYVRARELCQRVGDTSQLFPTLWGLWQFYVTQPQYKAAYELAAELLSLAQHVQDSALLLEAHFTVGYTFSYLGEMVSARTHLEQSIALYDPQQHGSHAFLYGQDPRVMCLSFVACALWWLGYPDQALQKSREALTLAQGLSHPHSLAFALGYAAAWLHQYRREVSLTQERAEATFTLSTEQGFTFWVNWSSILRGWALVEQGQGQEGIAQIRQGLDTFRSMKEEFAQTYYLALLAEAYGTVRQAEEGLTALAEALAAVDNTGERFYEAELYRLKGELTLQTSVQSLESRVKEAEACFQKAIDIARRQQAKSWELRAVMSLSRLWQQQGKKDEARQLLANIYNWFTEGFDTKDLQEAKALLEELS